MPPPAGCGVYVARVSVRAVSATFSDDPTCAGAAGPPGPAFFASRSHLHPTCGMLQRRGAQVAKSRSCARGRGDGEHAEVPVG